MKYSSIHQATFIKRPNRFIAHVELNGQEEIVHVKNTGRCKEILQTGSTVFLEEASNKNRKTKYSLISAYKGDTLINIDSQVPNTVVYESLEQNKIIEIKEIETIKKEVTFGNSRFDIFFKNKKGEGFIEVKGVTLEKDRVAMFPDAPTIRGRKHIKEMIKAINSSYQGYIFFLIQLKGVDYFTPNTVMDPDFTAALKLAKDKGVKILAYDCLITTDSIRIDKQIPIKI
ncbi:DNA/RNA nuclease SfsA [Natronospora cellulosivora (SeqCode)]